MFTNEIEHAAASLGLLLLRAGLGLLMLSLHGLPKLLNFGEELHHIEDPFHIGAYPTLIITILQEVGLSLLIVVGFATRLSSLPLVGTMLIAGFIVHADWSTDQRQFILLYLLGFMTLVFTGPGRYSLDAVIQKLGARPK